MEDDDPALPEIQALSRAALFTILRQETDRFDNLLDVINKSMKSLILAVKGEIVMSEHLEEAYYAMLNQRVPAQWKVSKSEK